MLRSVFCLFLVMLCGAAWAADRPTEPWNLNYTATSCEAKRRFGDTAIAIIPAPLGTTTRLMIEQPGRAKGAYQFPAQIKGAGMDSAKATALLYPLKSRKGFRGIYAVFPNAQFDPVLASGQIVLRVGESAKSTRTTTTQAFFDLDLGNTQAIKAALDKCMDGLRATWGMVDGVLPKPEVLTQTKGDVRGIFRSEDYPADAIEAGQSGTTQFLLMIDEKGGVMDCTIVQSSGIASLDAMGCQVIRERAKFVPARDAQGRPAKDTYVTPQIRWALSG